MVAILLKTFRAPYFKKKLCSIFPIISLSYILQDDRVFFLSICYENNAFWGCICFQIQINTIYMWRRHVPYDYKILKSKQQATGRKFKFHYNEVLIFRKHTNISLISPHVWLSLVTWPHPHYHADNSGDVLMDQRVYSGKSNTLTCTFSCRRNSEWKLLCNQ